MYKLILSILIY